MSSDKQAPDVYSRYVTTGFGEVHDFSPKEYELYFRYFSRNYDRRLPQRQ